MQQPSSQQPPSQQPTTASDTTSELKSDARDVTNKAADRLHSEVDARKGDAATQVRSTADAIQSAAGQLDQGAPQWLRSAFEQGAQQIQRFADSIEQKDSRQLLNEVQSFARERPALFLGAAAAAGFAAARIFKAGGEQQGAQQFGSNSEWDRSEPWGSGEQSRDEDFGQSDSFGQQFNEGMPSSQAQPFMARPATGSPTGTLGEIASDAQEDPLVLGTGGEAGRRVPGSGDY